MQREIYATPKLTVHEGTVNDLIVDGSLQTPTVKGIRLADGSEISASAVVSRCVNIWS